MGDEKGRGREVAVDPSVLDRIAVSEPLWADETADSEVLALLATIVQTRLTPRQREMVELHFYQGRSQQQIADQLGISQQVVSRQLFGVMRSGKRVGGAMRKLEKLLREKGIDFEG